MNESDCAIEIKNLNVRLNGVQILHDVNAYILANETTAIIGPNGAGKTTLLLAIMGLIPYTGQIHFPQGKRRIGYVPQRLDIDRSTPITVLDFLSLTEQKLPLWLRHKKRVYQKALSYLERVGAHHLIKHPLGRLSGGEMQRVMLAMALQNNPDIVLLDEPVSGVDIAGEELFSELISSLQKEEKFTLVLISHDLSVVTRHANHVICMNKTVRCTGRTVEVLTPETLTNIYGMHKGLYRHKHDNSMKKNDS